MKPRFVLYGNFESGNAYKVALMLTLSSGSYEYRHVPIFQGGARTPEFLKLNRFGEVPVLVDTARDDKVLAQSGVILWYLARELSRFGADNSDDELHLLEWLMFDNHRILPTVSRIRALRRFAKDPAPAVLSYVEGMAVQVMNLLDRELKERAWLVGASCTIADLQCSAYMFYFGETGLDEKRWPNVMAWRDRIAALPMWQSPKDLLPRE